MSTLHHTLDATLLPRGMVWIDEFEWTPVKKTVADSLTGAQLIDVGVRQGGRPITLQADRDAGWISRANLLLLQAQAALPGQVFTLSLATGQVFQVQFAPENPMRASTIARPELPTEFNPYVAVLRFFEV